MSAAPREATPEEVAKRLVDFEILDVREESEFGGPLGHLRNARSIPLGELEGRVDELPADAALLVVCRSGNRSGKACDWLADWGRPGATNLVGGMIAWNDSGLPVERARLEDPAAILETFAVWLSQVRRLPLDEARGRVQEAFDAEENADTSTGPHLVRTLTRVERAIEAEASPPADLALVCRALRADAAALDDGVDHATNERGSQ